MDVYMQKLLTLYGGGCERFFLCVSISGKTNDCLECLCFI